MRLKVRNRSLEINPGASKTMIFWLGFHPSNLQISHRELTSKYKIFHLHYFRIKQIVREEIHDGQGGLACWGSCGHKNWTWLSDWTELPSTEVRTNDSKSLQQSLLDYDPTTRSPVSLVLRTIYQDHQTIFPFREIEENNTQHWRFGEQGGCIWISVLAFKKFDLLF